MNHIYVNSDDIKETGYTYVLPKNVLKSSSPSPICGRRSPATCTASRRPTTRAVKEMRCVVLAPQWGNHQAVNLPTALPEHEYLDDLEPLGWMHTQPNETAAARPGRRVAARRHHGRQRVVGRRAVRRAHVLLHARLVLADRVQADARRLRVGPREQGQGRGEPAGYQSSHYEKVQMLLSDRFWGTTWSPTAGAGTTTSRG